MSDSTMEFADGFDELLVSMWIHSPHLIIFGKNLPHRVEQPFSEIDAASHITWLHIPFPLQFLHLRFIDPRLQNEDSFHPSLLVQIDWLGEKLPLVVVNLCLNDVPLLLPRPHGDEVWCAGCEVEQTEGRDLMNFVAASQNIHRHSQSIMDDSS